VNALHLAQLSVYSLVVFREHFVFLNVKSATPLRDALILLLIKSVSLIFKILIG